MDLGFPNEFAHPNEKAKEDYGLKVAKAVVGYDSRLGNGSTEYRRQRFHTNRKYAQGLQDFEQYKPLLGDYKGGNDYLNLMFGKVNPLKKYIVNATDVLVKGKYKPHASSLSPLSTFEKDKVKAEMLGNLMLSNLDKTVFKDTPIDVVPKGKMIPANMDEVMIHLELGVKSSEEIVGEISTNQVLENNDFELVRRANAHDLVNTSWAAREINYDEYGDIVMENFMPEDAIVFYSEDPYFRKSKVKGRRLMKTISEIWATNYNGKESVYTREELMELARKNATQYGNGSWSSTYYSENLNQPWNSFTVPCISFEWETTIDHAWLMKEREKGGKWIGKEDSAIQPKNKKQSVIRRRRSVYYDGLYVLGTEKMLKWGLRNNMPQDGSGLNDSRAMSRFIIVATDLYQMTTKAIPEAAQYHLDQIAIASYKLQHVVTKIGPSKVAIDLDAVEGIAEGLGAGADPRDLIKLNEQLGLMYYRGSQVTGMLPPIKEIPTQDQGKANELVGVISYHIQALESETGLNDVLAGSNQNGYEGLQSRQMKQESSIRSLSGHQACLDYMDDQSLKIISSMIKQSLIRGDYRMIRGLEKALGKVNVDIMKISKYESLEEMGITLKMLPTEADVERLMINIQREVDAGFLGSEDGEVIVQAAKENPKLAWRIAAIRREEYRKKRMEEAQLNAQANGKTQQESAAMAAELERQAKLFDHSLEMQKEAKISDLDREENRIQDLADMDKIRLKEEYKIKQIETANKNNLQNTESGNSAMKQPRVYQGAGA